MSASKNYQCKAEPLVFQLWDVESNNAVGAYSTELAAMDVVRSTLQRFGAADVLSLALYRVDGASPRLELLADGETLLERVQNHGRVASPAG
jgi:hypothetical protein